MCWGLMAATDICFGLSPKLSPPAALAVCGGRMWEFREASDFSPQLPALLLASIPSPPLLPSLASHSSPPCWCPTRYELSRHPLKDPSILKGPCVPPCSPVVSRNCCLMSGCLLSHEASFFPQYDYLLLLLWLECEPQFSWVVKLTPYAAVLEVGPLGGDNVTKDLCS